MSDKNLKKQIIDNLSAISHELQTPVNLISATAKLAGIKLVDNVENIDIIKNYMDNIITNCNKITMLISNITEIDTIANSRIEYANAKQFFDTFCKTAEPMCEDAGIKLSYDFDVKKDYVHIPVLTIERILLNLITNSIKYNDKDNKTIKIKMTDDDNNIIFSVKDNGIGISEENIPKVTEQFFRVDKDKAPGVGLGLTLVERYLKNINGTMEIKSKLKKGTEIILSIPFTSENDIFIAGEKNYVYIPEINSFRIEFAQLKLYDRI